MTSVESMVKIADDWLNSHRVSESWRIINMLRDELVRLNSQSTEG